MDDQELSNSPRRRDEVRPDTGHRRRKNDIKERQEEFRLRRDYALLFFGIFGLFALGVVASTVGFKDEAVALALATFFATFAGAPTALALDERRRNRNGRNDETNS